MASCLAANSSQTGYPNTSGNKEGAAGAETNSGHIHGTHEASRGRNPIAAAKADPLTALGSLSSRKSKPKANIAPKVKVAVVSKVKVAVKSTVKTVTKATPALKLALPMPASKAHSTKKEATCSFFGKQVALKLAPVATRVTKIKPPPAAPRAIAKEKERAKPQANTSPLTGFFHLFGAGPKKVAPKPASNTAATKKAMPKKGSAKESAKTGGIRRPPEALQRPPPLETARRLRQTRAPLPLAACSTLHQRSWRRPR